MESLIASLILQILFLLFLIKRNKNDGEKQLFKEQKWKPADVVLTILSVDILKFILYFLSKIDFINLFLKNNIYLPYLILLVLVITLLKFRFKQNIRTLGFKRNNLKKLIGMGIAVALISILIYHVLYILIEPSDYTVNRIKTLRNISNFSYLIQYIFLVVILAPVVEESIFRGILYSPYRKKYGPVGAIIFTALLFSSFHLEVGIVLYYFIIGIFIGLLYEKTESIVSTGIAHSLFNLLGFLSMRYML